MNNPGSVWRLSLDLGLTQGCKSLRSALSRTGGIMALVPWKDTSVVFINTRQTGEKGVGWIEWPPLPFSLAWPPRAPPRPSRWLPPRQDSRRRRRHRYRRRSCIRDRLDRGLEGSPQLKMVSFPSEQGVGSLEQRYYKGLVDSAIVVPAGKKARQLDRCMAIEKGVDCSIS